jgi:hypothetical protein
MGMKIDIAFPGDEAPPIPVGAITRLVPITGEADPDTVVAFCLVDARDGATLATLTLDQVTIDGVLASTARVRVAK